MGGVAKIEVWGAEVRLVCELGTPKEVRARFFTIFGGPKTVFDDFLFVFGRFSGVFWASEGGPKAVFDDLGGRPASKGEDSVVGKGEG